jgi:hypothetical protein
LSEAHAKVAEASEFHLATTCHALVPFISFGLLVIGEVLRMVSGGNHHKNIQHFVFEVNLSTL